MRHTSRQPILSAAIASMIAVCANSDARAQIKPETSGNLSHQEPELRKNGSGLTHSSVPRHRSRRPAR